MKRGVLCILLLVGWIEAEKKNAIENGGWTTDEKDIVKQNGICNIERHDANELTQKEFLKRYAYSEPVIIYNVDNSEFQKLTKKAAMLDSWGELPVTLNSANTYSYTRVATTFADYIDKKMKPQNLDKLGNETLILFGDIDQKLWAPLLEKYRKPEWELPDHLPALSFGIAGAGTGVPFHFHGPGFAEVVHGSKRWFLYPYEQRPKWNPDETTLEWYLNDYPNLAREDLPLECEMKPGELIYFPDKWWHATLNIQSSVFISTFLSP
ncbi:unnamed protein product [Caenorhabditis angaria]|uniref:JmjC domain-containing protein n=1 Tax=Caenorhabditis angaria TaxID=860376 RepID=A0A9P1IH64_9PELO|nr:unnamed protein product [Caenorhabditis angaria]